MNDIFVGYVIGSVLESDELDMAIYDVHLNPYFPTLLSSSYEKTNKWIIIV